MFYEGDLQSGIGKAIQESKLVACFVTDGGEESQLWENDFLKDPSLKSSFSEKTILLRLQAGSQEAEYLAAIFPLPQVPALVIIQSGELKEYLSSGLQKDEFLKRIDILLTSLATSSQSASTPVSTQVRNSDSTTAAPFTALTHEETLQADHSSTAPVANQNARPVATAEANSGPDAQAKQQKKSDKGKQKEDPSHQLKNGTPGVPDSERQYAAALKREQQDKRDERARILKRVEDDKIQRRKLAAERKAETDKAKDVAPTEVGSSRPEPQTSVQYKECALQIRLFDGSTIRSRFPSSASLRVDVRPWVDEHQEVNTSYTFKQIVTPLPIRTITISDEEESLQSQGFAPSATLILAPGQGYTAAYEGGNTGSVVSRSVSAGYGLASSAVGMVTGLFGGLLGGTTGPQDEPTTPINTAPSGQNINVRTLRDQSRQDDQQFYNGNALNFEPRNDDDDKRNE